MRNFRMLALGASLLVLSSACGTGGGSPSPTSGAASPTPAAATATPAGQLPAITIGSAGFDESELIAEIYAQVLEARGHAVTRQFSIGPRTQTTPALESGQIDLMPEYIGSLLEFLVKDAGDPPGEATGDSEATAQKLDQRLAEHQLTALAFSPAQDSNAFVVRPETADAHGLAKMSDLAAVENELTWGLPPECETNPLCGGALRDEYGIDFDSITLVEYEPCSGEMAAALGTSGQGAVDIGELCSTQADITRFGLVVLEDDKQTQPAENLLPVFNNAWLDEAGGEEPLAVILDPVTTGLTTEDLLAMNARIAIDQEDIDVVAREWLTDKGLLP